jgi:hypothetical protein
MSGSEIVRPLEMLARATMIACSITLLPAVRAVMRSASRIGTPEETSVPSVRVKRATAAFRMSGPKTGNAEEEPVDDDLSLLGLVGVAQGEERDHRARAARYQTWSIVKCERLITNWVGRGQRLPEAREHVREDRGSPR